MALLFPLSQYLLLHSLWCVCVCVRCAKAFLCAKHGEKGRNCGQAGPEASPSVLLCCALPSGRHRADMGLPDEGTTSGRQMHSLQVRCTGQMQRLAVLIDKLMMMMRRRRSVVLPLIRCNIQRPTCPIHSGSLQKRRPEMIHSYRNWHTGAKFCVVKM